MATESQKEHYQNNITFIESYNESRGQTCWVVNKDGIRIGYLTVSYKQEGSTAFLNLDEEKNIDQGTRSQILQLFKSTILPGLNVSFKNEQKQK